MFGLLSKLIPQPYAALVSAAVVAVVTAVIFGTGFHYGDAHRATIDEAAKAKALAAQEKALEDQNKSIAQAVDAANVQNQKDIAAALARTDLQRQIDDKFSSLSAQLSKSAQTKAAFKDPNCTYDQSDLDMWNGKTSAQGATK